MQHLSLWVEGSRQITWLNTAESGVSPKSVQIEVGHFPSVAVHAFFCYHDTSGTARDKIKESPAEHP